VENRERLQGVFYVEASHMNAPAWGHYICGNCARENQISELRTIWKDDDSLDRLFAMKCNVSPVCSRCFHDAMNTK